MKKALPLIAVFLVLAMAHPFYLGVCELRYNNKDKTLQGSVKLFVNDLEDALKRLGNKNVDLIHVKDTEVTNKMLADYLAKRLQISVNGKALPYKLLGFEREEEALWLYIEAKSPKPKRLEVKCNLLYDFIKQQMTIFHVEADGKKQSLKIENPENTARFELE